MHFTLSNNLSNSNICIRRFNEKLSLLQICTSRFERFKLSFIYRTDVSWWYFIFEFHTSKCIRMNCNIPEINHAYNAQSSPLKARYAIDIPPFNAEIMKTTQSSSFVSHFRDDLFAWRAKYAYVMVCETSFRKEFSFFLAHTAREELLIILSHYISHPINRLTCSRPRSVSNLHVRDCKKSMCHSIKV